MRRTHVRAAAAAVRNRAGTATILLVLAVTVLAATAAGGAVGAGPDGGASSDVALPPPDGYAVVQSARCTDVAPVTGSRDVTDAYDYRNPFPEVTGNPEDSSYSAFGFREYQRGGASTLFLYRGPGGDSLVFLHGELDAPSENGSTAQFTIENLPAGGEWAVQDDEYPDRDDVWDVTPTSTTVDWGWAPERTDGGAYRGVAATDGAIRIDARFNGTAPRWGQWRHSGAPEHTVDTWRVVGADGRTTALAMDDPAYVVPGPCGDLPTANATLDATPGAIPRDRTVSLSAGAVGPGSDLPVLEYRWDVDGDGTVDRVTETPSIDVTYETAGRYRPTVRVRTAAGPGPATATTVAVGQSNRPAITVVGVEADDAVAGDPTTVTVEVVNDGGGAGTVDLEAFADGELVGERSVRVASVSSTTVELNVTVPDAGDYDLTVGEATTTVSVAERDPQLRVDGLAAPDTVVAGRSVDVVAQVSNVGNAAGEFDVALERDGEVVAERSVRLDAGQSGEVAFEDAVDDPGEYTFAVGDRTASTRVVEVDPELSVADVTVESPVDAGAETTVTAVVENTGNAEASFDVPIELFGEVVAVRGVTLAPGERTTVTFATTVDEPGEYTVRVGDESRTLTVVGSAATTTRPGTDAADASGSLSGPSVLATLGAVLIVVLVALRRGRR